MSPGVVGTGEGVWIRRKAFHALVGTVLAISALAWDPLKWFYLLVLGGGLLLSLVMEKCPIKWLKWFLDRYDKIEDTVPGQGPIAFFTGILLAWFIFGWEIAAVAIIVLTFGDPLAYVIGKSIGGPKIPWNRKKTIAGAVAMIIAPAVLISLIWNPVLGITAGAIGAISESLPFPKRLIFDDNITVPAITSTVIWFIVLMYPGLL